MGHAISPLRADNSTKRETCVLPLDQQCENRAAHARPRAALVPARISEKIVSLSWLYCGGRILQKLCVVCETLTAFCLLAFPVRTQDMKAVVDQIVAETNEGLNVPAQAAVAG